MADKRAMISIDNMTDSQFDTVALEILGCEFGVDGLARFLRLHRSGQGDYTAERCKTLQDISVDDVAQSIQTRSSKTA